MEEFMKLLSTLLIFTSLGVQGEINMNLKLQSHNAGKLNKIEKELLMELDKPVRFEQGNNIIEMSVNNDFSEIGDSTQITNDSLYVDMKIYEKNGNKKKLISSPGLILKRNQTGRFEMSDESQDSGLDIELSHF
jgi:hypothetical protein